MSESRKQFERKEILIRRDQEQAVQADADARYPMFHGPKKTKRNFSPAMRDILDFWIDHPVLFFTWLASRNKTPQEPTP